MVYMFSDKSLDFGLITIFPTCQVRVVRFYHSCSPPLPPRLALLLLLLLRLLLFLLQFLLDHQLLPSLPPCQLFAKLFANFRAQWAPLDLNGQIECQKICQIEHQIECQIECQKICQIKYNASPRTGHPCDTATDEPPSHHKLHGRQGRVSTAVGCTFLF